MEDDYIPYSDNYDEKLMSFFNDPEDVPPDPFNINNLQENLNTNQLSHPFKTCYVTQLFRHMHCSMSCGMISNSAYREINNEYGFGFMLHRLDNGAYGFIEQCQRGFLNKFIRQGYIIRDLHRKYYSPFLNHEGKIVKYGVPDGEALIAPIYPPFVGVADEEILYLDDPERL